MRGRTMIWSEIAPCWSDGDPVHRNRLLGDEASCHLIRPVFSRPVDIARHSCPSLRSGPVEGRR